MQDTFMQDTFMQDTFMQDTFMQDTFMQDTFMQDTFMQDTFMQDTFMQDTFMQDTFMQDTFMQDTFMQDTFLQDTFMKVHQSLSQLRHPERVAGWLFRIARNGIVEYYRRRNKVPATLPDDMTLVVPATESNDAGLPDLNSEVAAGLRPMIDQLPDGYRQAIEVTAFEGATQRELAERLGISVSGPSPGFSAPGPC